MFLLPVSALSVLSPVRLSGLGFPFLNYRPQVLTLGVMWSGPVWAAKTLFTFFCADETRR